MGDPAVVISSFYDAYAARDPDSAAGLYTPDGRHEEIATGQHRMGREEIAAGLQRFFDAFPEAVWVPENPYLRGDGAAVPYTLRGTLRSQLGPYEPRDQQLDLRGIHVLELADGMIRRSSDYWDASTFDRQMRA